MLSDLIPLSDPRVVALREAAGRAERTLRFYASVGIEVGNGERRKLPAQRVGTKWFVRLEDAQAFLGSLPRATAQ